MQPRFLLHTVRALCTVFALQLYLPAQASPVLRCQMLQGDSTFVHEVVPSANPYSFVPLDIRNRFRLNAVMVGDDRQIDYVKVYAYYYQHGQPVIAHMAHYPSPSVQTNEHQPPLTGLQRVYAPPYGFELQYHCVLFDRFTGAVQ